MPTIFWHSSGLKKNGELDKESMIRLKKAFSVYTELIKGGIPQNQIYFISTISSGKPTLSELMKATLMEWGIKEGIIAANLSTHTLADIRNSFGLIKERNLPQPIINVSSWYHIPRMRLMWFALRNKFGHPKLIFVASGATHYMWALKEPVKILRFLRQLKRLSDY